MPLGPDGRIYDNTKRAWNILCEAAKYARVLGLIDPELIIDMRTPTPFIPFKLASDDILSASVILKELQWHIPTIDYRLKDSLMLTPPDIEMSGYEYDGRLQPYHIEIWCEKSTMNYILEPLCKKYSIPLIFGVGYFTITSVIEFCKRVLKVNKPVRILYISDFDPAGVNMPVSVARHIEFWKERYSIHHDIKLDNVLLTKEQVRKYNLPRIPIKDSDRRKENFKHKFGEGAVELDALEALYPGEFEKIVESAILELIDPKLEGKIKNLKEETNQQVKNIWRKVMHSYEKEFDSVEKSVSAILSKYETQLKAISKAMDEELSPYKEHLKSLHSKILHDFNEMRSKIKLPDMPVPEVHNDCSFSKEWLFDSEREYLEQLKHYQKLQTKVS